MTSSEHAYWIHDRRESDTSVMGYLYLPSCRCSRCGHQAGIEKDICPQCGAVMDETAPVDPPLPRREEIIEKISNDVKSMPEGTRTTTMELVSRYAGRDAEQLYGREGLIEMDEAFCVKAKDDILVPTGVDNDSLGQPYTIPFLVMHHHKQ